MKIRRMVLSAVVKFRLVVFAAMLAASTIGCIRPVTVYPPVNSSLGYSVFLALSEINRAPLHIGLFFEPKLTDNKIQFKGELGTTEIAIGEVFSSKLIQVLSYKFERISLVKDRTQGNVPSLLFTIELEGEGPLVGVDLNRYSQTFEVVVKIDARLRATLSQNGQSVWVGHGRTTQEMVSGGGIYRVADASAQAAELANRVSDLLVADLILQVQRSEELKKFLEASKP